MDEQILNGEQLKEVTGGDDPASILDGLYSMVNTPDRRNRCRYWGQSDLETGREYCKHGRPKFDYVKFTDK